MWILQFFIRGLACSRDGYLNLFKGRRSSAFVELTVSGGMVKLLFF